jgi:sugar lactone lactonase YvrE
MASTPRVLGDFRAKLGESPVWTDDGRLALVDISDRSLVVLDPSTAAVVRAPLPTTPGCVLRSKKGGLLVALTVDDAAKQPGGRIYRVAAPTAPDAPDAPVADLDALACDVLNKNIHPKLDDDASPPMVLNDAAVDARGRVWIGCKLLSPPPSPGSPGQPPGALFCCESAFAFRDGAVVAVGSAQVVPEVGGVHTSNGIGWSPEGTTMYHVDSPRRRVDAYDFDVTSGMLTNPRVFADVGPEGVPDGLCVDVEGGVWVCVWDGGKVVRYLPAAAAGEGDGQGGRPSKIEREVAFPCSRPTSACFGEGAFATTLFVTSCSLDDTVDADAKSLSASEPTAGAVFALDVGVKGVAVHAAAF